MNHESEPTGSFPESRSDTTDQERVDSEESPDTPDEGPQQMDSAALEQLVWDAFHCPTGDPLDKRIKDTLAASGDKKTQIAAPIANNTTRGVAYTVCTD